MIKDYEVKILKEYYIILKGIDYKAILDQINFIINNTNNLEKGVISTKIKIREKNEKDNENI